MRKNNVAPVDISEGDIIYERNTDLYEAYEKVEYINTFSELVKDYDDGQIFYISSDISTTYRDLRIIRDFSVIRDFMVIRDFGLLEILVVL